MDTLRDHRLTTTVTNNNKNNAGSGADDVSSPPPTHRLHSAAVEKLSVGETTAEDVVRAIKRAQNLHDLHDVREIAHFLLEEVGTLFRVLCVLFGNV